MKSAAPPPDVLGDLSAGVGQRTRRDLAVSMLDQAVLSGTGFLVAGTFVATSNKQEFAIYSLYWAAIQLTTSIQNATILTPLIANFRKLHGQERLSFVGVLTRLGQRLSILGAVAVGITCLLITAIQRRPDCALAGAVGLALIGTWARDLRRTRQFAELRSTMVLGGDLIYAIVLALAVFVGSTFWAPLAASWALLAWGVAGLVTGGPWEWRVAHAGGDSIPSAKIRGVLSSQIRWTLPSVAVSWLQANAYNFVTAATSGIHSVADINSARLFAAPVSMAHAGWNRIFLPTAALAISSGKRSKAIRLGLMGVAILSSGCVVYAISLFLGSAIVRRLSTAIRVEHLGWLIGLWLAYMLVVGARGVGTSILVAETAFAPLFRYGLVAAVTTLVAMIVCGEHWGSRGVMAAMVIGEGILGLLVWQRVLLAKCRVHEGLRAC